MIVLDTNVVSEPLRRHPDERVLGWMLDRSETVITAVTVGELLVGVRSLPAGRRRDGLTESVEVVISTFGSRVLAYDARSAREYAAIRDQCRRSGRGIGTEDAMIAAIVRAHGASLATRNVRDFEGLGFDLVNPWDHQP